MNEFSNQTPIVQGLDAATRMLAQVGLEHQPENAWTQGFVHPMTHLAQDFAAQVFKQLHHCVRHYHCQREHQQGREVSALDDAIVDLEHVDRRCQHQQAGNQPKPECSPEAGAVDLKKGEHFALGHSRRRTSRGTGGYARTFGPTLVPMDA